MDTKTIQAPIKQFIQALPKKINLDKIIVFGSYAQKKANKDSDIDLVLISNNFAKMNQEERSDMLYKASRFIEPDIHPWGFTQAELDQADAQSTLGIARSQGIVVNFN